MSMAAALAEKPGIWFGTGDGPESGPFVARIEVRVLPNGGVSIDYEATSTEQGVQHREHSILNAGPGGLDRLFIAHAESPFVTEMTETASGSGHFTQTTPFGPYAMEIVLELPETDRLTFAWRWAMAGETPTEQSKADVRRSGSVG